MKYSQTWIFLEDLPLYFKFWQTFLKFVLFFSKKLTVWVRILFFNKSKKFINQISCNICLRIEYRPYLTQFLLEPKVEVITTKVLKNIKKWNIFDNYFVHIYKLQITTVTQALSKAKKNWFSNFSEVEYLAFDMSCCLISE